MRLLSCVGYGDGVKNTFAAFPVRHAAGEQAVKCLGVVMVLQVAELVHDDVLNAVYRGLNQGDVERDATGGSATSPPRAHTSDYELGLGDAVTGTGLVTFCKVATEGLLGTLPVPGVDPLANGVPVALVRDSDMEEATAQLGG